MNIGQRIKRARIEKGLTQEELAEKVGVQKSAVAKWENGRVSEIKRSNLAKISKALGINPNSLLENIEKEPVKTAEQHIEIITDEDYVEMFEDFKLLDSTQRKIVKDLVKSLAEQKKQKSYGLPNSFFTRVKRYTI